MLLVDFPDREHDPNRGPSYYDAMLFSEGIFPTGSMRDFYRRVSGYDGDAGTGIDVQGRDPRLVPDAAPAHVLRRRQLRHEQ